MTRRGLTVTLVFVLGLLLVSLSSGAGDTQSAFAQEITPTPTPTLSAPPYFGFAATITAENDGDLVYQILAGSGFSLNEGTCDPVPKFGVKCQVGGILQTKNVYGTDDYSWASSPVASHVEEIVVEKIGPNEFMMQAVLSVVFEHGGEISIIWEGAGVTAPMD
jgi:hypothetical protein